MSGDITKKMVNSASSCVEESLSGYVTLHPTLKLLKQCPRVVIRSDIVEYKHCGKVTILTGGGSGHEPLFAGYVGPGMASAAVHGSIFASPGPSAILAGLRAVGADHPAGVVVVFNNYTGDRLNFGIAMERAKLEGIRADIVCVADDCAMMAKDKSAGRRGLAGCILMMKIVGALAEQGATLPDIVTQARDVARGLGTLGLCLYPCSRPGTPLLFHIDNNTMELGLGLHGEAGVKSEKLKPAAETVELMLNHMMNPDNKAHISLASGTSIAMLINNLGSTSDLEINIIVKEAVQRLEALGVHVERLYAGRYATSQEMAGFSISLMTINSSLKQCLDLETSVPAWIPPLLHPRQTLGPFIDLHDTSAHVQFADTASILSRDIASTLEHVLGSVCRALLDAEDKLNQLDSGSGDGDCGSTLAEGAKAIMDRMESKEHEKRLPWSRPHDLFLTLAEVVEGAMGGCSGALYSLLLTSMATSLYKDVSAVGWVAAAESGLLAIMKYGHAEPGDRTMVDPINAAVTVLKTSSHPDVTLLVKAAQAATEEAEATACMDARAGRASYVSEDRLTQPDPGAVAVSTWMQALLKAVQHQ